ncbi:MAG: hypothetical protein WDZ29_05110 [Balneolaceae bacterium]
MSYRIKRIEFKREVEHFHHLPFEIYEDYPNWVPPFRAEIEKIFDPEQNSYFMHGECERFLVWQGKEVVGRFALMNNQRKDHLFNPKMGGMGFTELRKDVDLMKSIIDFASEWHGKRGYGAFRGPVNFGENDNYWGLLVENFDDPPIYGMLYHPPWYRDLFEASGAEKYDDHWSYSRQFSEPLPDRLVRITDRIASRADVELRPIDMQNLDRDAESIRMIYNEAWRDQDIVERGQEFTELTEETIREMVQKLKRIMIPESVLLAFVNGEPASFIVCIPDLNEISARTNGRLRWWNIWSLIRLKHSASRLRTVVYGTLPKYRKMGLEALTFVKGIEMTHSAAPNLESLEGAWVSEKNWLMQRSLEALGCTHHKTHRTYRWSIE